MMENLLIKYIIGEADILERQQVEAWVEAHPDNKKHFEQTKSVWESSKMAHASNPDVEQAWQRFQDKINVTKSAPKMAVRKGGKWKLFAAAAAILVVALAGIQFYWNSSIQFETLAQTETLTLPDQSVATLNSASKLSYTRSFNSKDRVVQLEGEAFFDVAKNPEKPFIIHVKDVDVKVLGTSFNIRSNEDLTEVTVETGSVKVTRANETYTLSPSQKLTFLKSETKASLSTINSQLYQYYRSKMFVCDRTPLPDLVKTLSEVYKVEIKIANPVLEQQLLTSKFPTTAPVQEILETVAMTLNARLEQQGAVYVIK